MKMSDGIKEVQGTAGIQAMARAQTMGRRSADEFAHLAFRINIAKDRYLVVSMQKPIIQSTKVSQICDYRLFSSQVGVCHTNNC
jgi:hypothetical protein